MIRITPKIVKGKVPTQKLRDKDAERKMREARQVALYFAEDLRRKIENGIFKIKPKKSGFTAIYENAKSLEPLYYTGALWRIGRRPTLKNLVRNSKIQIGKYIYIQNTGYGFRVGFYYYNRMAYDEPRNKAPFNKDRKRKLYLKDLLYIIENGAKIEISAKMIRFYYAVMAWRKRDVPQKKRLGRPKKFWKIPARPFWKKAVREFRKLYQSEYEVSTSLSFPYSVFIRRLR